METPEPYKVIHTPGTVLVAKGGIVIEKPVTTVSKSQAPDTSGDFALLERIAVCESQNRADAKNPRSSASGRFQFLTGSWEAYGRQLWGTTEGKDVFSYEDNTELAEYVFSTEGTRPWESSRYCWGV